ncbi:MAG TPA: hypothetical protein VGG39_34280 [Polyangiaceae bacterium]|jgi:hypothetical protein
MRKALLPLVPLAALLLLGCSKDESSAGPAASASAAPTASAAPSASAPAPVASTPPEPPHDCPPGSSGPGSFTKPCEAHGKSRAMEVKWTKTGDSGPSFAITNKTKIVILYGKIAVYFYDKSGKQLDVVDESVTPSVTRHYHTCSGSFFGGVMNPNEREVLTFSCVPKKIIPDGTATVDAEMQMVGFADASGKKVDYYWRNADLTPDTRPKGGVK